MNIQASAVTTAICAFEEYVKEDFAATNNWYEDGTPINVAYVDMSVIAKAKSNNINDAILKLEYGVDMMEEFSVFDDGISDEFFDLIKAGLSDLRKLTN